MEGNNWYNVILLLSHYAKTVMTASSSCFFPLAQDFGSSQPRPGHPFSSNSVFPRGWNYKHAYLSLSGLACCRLTETLSKLDSDDLPQKSS